LNPNPAAFGRLFHAQPQGSINYVKDTLIWAADWVEDHPWITLGIMLALTVLVVLF
jgi:ElaB/YqjD/DUF883 family membrane-anchored ribosome-binding protein